MKEEVPDLGEHLLGFSARTHENRYDEDWPQARRDLYLLRMDLDRPLSTDSAVWPVVSGKPSSGPPWQRSVNVWNELLGLLQAAPSTPAYDVVAITLVLETLTKDQQAEWRDIESLDVTSDLPGASTRLGYDISDRSLLSGLSNCGYSMEDASELRPIWGPRLNRYHLFSQRADAVMFKELTDRRVPEHAPFYCYGLYLVLPSPQPQS